MTKHITTSPMRSGAMFESLVVSVRAGLSSRLSNMLDPIAEGER
jgi:hypothetical protein